MERLICLLIGYACGLIQTAYIYGRINHIDIRKYGSGNAGTTNALRTLGFKAGLITFIGDLLKVVLATMIVRLIFTDSHPDSITVLVLYTGLGVVLGHNFPFYLGFKGGKGIAATAGLILSLGSWQMVVIGLAVFILIVAFTRYISLGSLVMVTTEFALFVLFDYLGILTGIETKAASIEGACVMALFVVFAFIRHRANIVRLVHGSENKFSFKSQKNKPEE